jgi:hypothetical protein
MSSSTGDERLRYLMLPPLLLEPHDFLLKSQILLVHDTKLFLGLTHPTTNISNFAIGSLRRVERIQKRDQESKKRPRLLPFQVFDKIFGCRPDRWIHIRVFGINLLGSGGRGTIPKGTKKRSNNGALCGGCCRAESDAYERVIRSELICAIDCTGRCLAVRTVGPNIRNVCRYCARTADQVTQFEHMAVIAYTDRSRHAITVSGPATSCHGARGILWEDHDLRPGRTLHSARRRPRGRPTATHGDQRRPRRHGPGRTSGGRDRGVGRSPWQRTGRFAIMLHFGAKWGAQ